MARNELNTWRTEKFEDCLDALIDYRGKSPTKSTTGIPVLSAKVVKTSGLLRPIEQTISADYYPKWMTRGLPRPGDIVMTTEAPLGEIIQLNQETAQFALGQRIVCLRAKANLLDNTFLRYLLTSPQQQDILSSRATGTTVLGISQKSLREMPISFPELSTQKKIGFLLAALDNKIELNQQMNVTLEAMARAIFKDWFVDFGPTRTKMAMRGDNPQRENTAPAPYLAPDIWALFPDRLDDERKPEGWPAGSIVDCVERIQNGGTPSRSNETYWKEGDIPWLTSGEVRQDIVIETTNFITKEGLHSSSAKLLPPMIPLVALYGATAGQVTLSAVPLTTNQAISAIIPRKNYRFYTLLHLKSQVSALENSAVGSAQQNISKGIVEELPTLVPSENVAEAFEQTVAPLYDLAVKNLKEARSLASTRDLLLPKLMSGEIHAKDVEKIADEAL